MKTIAAASALLLSAVCAQAATRVAVIAPGELPAPARHGLAKLRDTLRDKGFEVTSSPTGAAYLIHARITSGPAEALTIRKETQSGKPAVFLEGAGANGLMYAALDTADRISWSSTQNPFEHVRAVQEEPYLAERGISMYTMQRAYFESRLYDEEYWRRYFDLLAAGRINRFVVIFGYENGGFMAPLYPYFFNLKEFPQVELVGITAQQQARNTEAFHTLIRTAHERGIEVTAAIWDHIYRGGVQGGGIPGASQNAGKRVPGLVWGVTAENLSAYTKAALKRFLVVFPEIDALQFRMHDESGLKHEEIQPFWHDVFLSIRQTHPRLRLDLRAKELPDAVIDDALRLGLRVKISTKYWMEQMGLPFHPTHINTQNQHDRRHGYADLLRYPQRYRVHWQLWSGGTTRLLLWADPDYVRRFAQSARLYDGDSFEINEMLATKMLGEPHDEKPLEILNPRYRYYRYEFERYWAFYRLWGRLTYNPRTSSDVWEQEFITRFGPQSGPALMRGLELASRVLPRIVAASYLYRNFPTTRGWAEMNRQGSLPQYAGEDGSDIQQFMNVRDEAAGILNGTDTAMRRPEATSLWFAQTADAILDQVKLAGRQNGNEFQSIVTDLKILAGLARYHSYRLLAGVCYNLYKQSGSLASFDDAISRERQALTAWKEIVDAAGDVYSENLAFGPHAVGFSRHWKEEYQLLSKDFENLLAGRRKAVGTQAAGKPVKMASGDPQASVHLTSAPAAEPGRDFLVSAKVAAPAGVKWLRLRYRHVTQFEDYQSAEMTLDPKSGLYSARIPAAFLTPNWDLMYFVELLDNNGRGRMYPDLEVETPYVFVRLKR
jgi:hypothetical protein